MIPTMEDLVNCDEPTGIGRHVEDLVHAMGFDHPPTPLAGRNRWLHRHRFLDKDTDKERPLLPQQLGGVSSS